MRRCVTYRHASEQCPACLSTNTLTAWHAINVRNYIMSRSNCRKTHDSYKVEEAFNLMSKGISCAKISRMLDIPHGTLRSWKKNGNYIIYVVYHYIIMYEMHCHVFMISYYVNLTSYNRNKMLNRYLDR